MLNSSLCLSIRPRNSHNVTVRPMETYKNTDMSLLKQKNDGVCITFSIPFNNCLIISHNSCTSWYSYSDVGMYTCTKKTLSGSLHHYCYANSNPLISGIMHGKITTSYIASSYHRTSLAPRTDTAFLKTSNFRFSNLPPRFQVLQFQVPILKLWYSSVCICMYVCYRYMSTQLLRMKLCMCSTDHS
jgi:hypothetical protein